MNLNLSLHKTQKNVWYAPARFKVIVAGRRWGKTRYAVQELLVKGLQATDGVGFYVAPTLQQAKDLVWQLFKDLLANTPGVKFLENTGEITLPNGRKIMLKGSDRPDTLRGNKLFHAVIDEYQDMKPMVFESIIRPALGDLEGTATIIGTPKGKNHFWHFVRKAEATEGWAYFHYSTYDNPFIPRKEIEAMKAEMSSFFFEQEIMAKFKVMSSDLFHSDWIKKARMADNPIIRQAPTITAVDLAGYTDFEQAMKMTNPLSRLDEFAICPVKVFGKQWHVLPIVSGRDTLGRTARRIIETSALHKSVTLGVEKGALFQAIYPTLMQEMSKIASPFRLEALTHGNKGKVERILWALQGKMEHGHITFEPGEYLDKFIDQLLQIPSKGVHDDLPDALSMIAQMAPLGIYVDAKDMIQDYTDTMSTDY